MDLIVLLGCFVLTYLRSTQYDTSHYKSTQEQTQNWQEQTQTYMPVTDTDMQVLLQCHIQCTTI